MIKPDELQIPYLESQIEALERELHKLQAQFDVAIWLLEDLARTDNTAGILAQQALIDIAKMRGGE